MKIKKMNVIKSALCIMLFAGVSTIIVAQNAPGQNYIGEERAKTIALNHAKVNARDINHIIVQLNDNRRGAIYDIEFWVGNKEYDYEIDATNGNIISYDYDAESNYPGNRQNQQQNSAQYISESQATSIALKHAGIRESDTTALRCKLDSSGRIAEYEIEWRVGRTEYEYTINATTGNIMEFDVDKGF